MVEYPNPIVLQKRNYSYPSLQHPSLSLQSHLTPRTFLLPTEVTAGLTIGFSNLPGSVLPLESHMLCPQFEKPLLFSFTSQVTPTAS